MPASPEKSDRAGVLSPMRRAGAMSAPPAAMQRADVATGEVRSFEDRLREGGFGARGLGARSVFAARGGKGKGRVGFGDVEELG